MKEAYWGFLAGIMFMAAVIVVELWALTPRHAVAGTEYGTGVAYGMRDC